MCACVRERERGGVGLVGMSECKGPTMGALVLRLNQHPSTTHGNTMYGHFGMCLNIVCLHVAHI